MRLYKFRSLGDQDSFNRILEIVNSGQFYCARFWELNDPMEGVYRIGPNSPNYRDVFEEKAGRRICSLSAAKALRNPLMWGYYANGFKGVAIEIDAECGDQLHKVNYVQKVLCIDGGASAGDYANTILSSKLNKWKHEHEYRFVVGSPDKTHRIGTIKSIIFGIPYPGSLIDDDHRDGHMPKLKEYRERLKGIMESARMKGLVVRTASMQGDRVQIGPIGVIDPWYNQ